MASEPDGDDGELAIDTTAQAVQLLTHHDTKSYGGSFFATAFYYVTEDGLASGACSPGTKHPSVPTIQWHSNMGGFCQFVGWNGGDHDCRAVVQGSTGGGGFGGTCDTWVDEQLELPANSFSYSASNTNSAQFGTTDRQITLAAGQTLTIGTCGVAGSSFSGDTYIRLLNSSSTQVMDSDDACGGIGSSFSFTALKKDTFTVRAGCFANNT
ncbi:MAG: hypothetical protein ACREBE_07690, partial [bacterium]